MHRASAAKRDDRELPRVAPAPHRDELEEVDHVRVRDPNHPERRVLGVDAERFRERSQGSLRTADIELDPPPEEVVRVDPVGDHVRVRQRWLRPAPAVAGRPGVGACAVRPHLERSGGVDPRDRATSRPDLDDVDDRDLDRIAGEHRRALEVVVAGKADGTSLDE